MKINTDCDLNVTLHNRRVVEITTIYDNRFIRRLYVGYSMKEAKQKFKTALMKGEI